MKKKPEIEIVEKHNAKPCMCTHKLEGGVHFKKEPDKNCTSCFGSGVIEDNIYFHTANGICFDGDTIK